MASTPIFKNSDTNEQKRDLVRKRIVSEFAAKFPITSPRGIALEVANLNLKEADAETAKLKSLNSATFSEQLKGDVTVTENGKVLFSVPNIVLSSFPALTTRNTFIINGTEYNPVNQLRTNSGVYVRKRANESIEAAFNTEKGSNFSLNLDETSGNITMAMNGRNANLLSVLKVLGATAQEISQYLPTDILNANAKGNNDIAIGKATLLLQDFLGKASDKGVALSPDKLAARLAESTINPDTTKITLGQAHDHVSITTILQAAKKMIDINKQTGLDDMNPNKTQPDERDQLTFQKLYTVDDFMGLSIEKNKQFIWKIRQRLNTFPTNAPKAEQVDYVRAIFNQNNMVRDAVSHITGSSIVRTTEATNPIDLQDANNIVTRLGEGGITNERAIVDDAKVLQESYYGVIDPVATPESGKVGIDGALTNGIAKDKDNNILRKVVNVKTGKEEYLKVVSTYDVPIAMAPIKPADITSKTPVSVIYRNRVTKMPADTIQYYVPTHSIFTTSVASIPLPNSSQGNRLVMGRKHVVQAMALKEGDERLVKSIANEKGQSVEEIIGDQHVIKSPVSGTIVKAEIDTKQLDFIDIEIAVDNKKGGDQRKEIYTIKKGLNVIPAASHVRNNYVLTVKIGDHVSAGDVVAKTVYHDLSNPNSTSLALGKNLHVAYMPYHGLNHEDAIVISQTTANKMTSLHTYTYELELNKAVTVGKKPYIASFGGKGNYVSQQLAKVDDSGVVKEGTVLKYGDPIILAIETMEAPAGLSSTAKVFKVFRQGMADKSVVYDQDFPGVVKHVVKPTTISGTIKVYVDIDKPAVAGDKMAGSYGNKGIISKVVPDEQMPFTVDSKGNQRKLDVMLTPMGVFGRVNSSQIQETLLGKVAEKTGKGYHIDPFNQGNDVFVEKELQKNGVAKTEKVLVPTVAADGTTIRNADGSIATRELPSVTTGIQHMYKLKKMTDSNFSARGHEGAFDALGRPAGSGETAPKAIGSLALNALIARNASGVLKDLTVRGQQDINYWTAYKNGYTPAIPTKKVAFEQLQGHMKQALIDMKVDGNKYRLTPMTDSDVLSLSRGGIENPHRLDYNRRPEKGGLFDKDIVGGTTGTTWNHIHQGEYIVSPVFEKVVAMLLNMSNKDFKTMYEQQGGNVIRQKIQSINIDQRIKELEDVIAKHRSSDLDSAVKAVKMLKNLKGTGTKIEDVLTLKNLPVLPAVFRPISVDTSGKVIESSVNSLYADNILAVKNLQDMKDIGMPGKIVDARRALHDTARSIVGTKLTSNEEILDKNPRSGINLISGSTPKYGFAQRRTLRTELMGAGRATIAPDSHLGVDEIGLPEDMALGMYKPHLQNRLSKLGINPIDQEEHFEKKTPLLKKLLQEEVDKRPVFITRDPVLWEFNTIGAKPKLVPGKTMYINSLIEKGLNADFDGDAMTVHVPHSDEAIRDVKRMLPSNNLYTHNKRDNLLVAPSNESVLGNYIATKADVTKKTITFNTLEDAKKAWDRGEYTHDTPINILRK